MPLICWIRNKIVPHFPTIKLLAIAPLTCPLTYFSLFVGVVMWYSKYVCSTHCSLWELFSRMQPWEGNVLLRLHRQHTLLNQVKASLQTVKIMRSRCGDLLSCGHPRQASCVNSLTYYNCHLLIWDGLPLFSLSPCSLYMGASFRFHPGSARVFEPTLLSIF